MILRVFTLILLSLQLFAGEYNNALLDIQAKLFPKIAMLEKNIRSNNSSFLSLSIVSQEIDFTTAKKLKSRILKAYPNKILNKQVQVTIVSIDTIADSDALIALYHSQKDINNIAQWANQNNILSFAYDSSDLENGILASLYLGKRTKPYLNRKVLQNYNFYFDSYLLQVAKFKE